MAYTEKELNLRKKFDEYQKIYGKEDLLRLWDAKILELDNHALSAYFALLDGIHAKEHADIVLKSGDLVSIFELSEKYPECRQRILESNNFEYNFGIVKKLFEQGVTAADGPFFDTEPYSNKIKEHVEVMSNSLETDKTKDFIEWYFNKYGREIFVESNGQYVKEKIGHRLLEKINIYIDTFIFNFSQTADADALYSIYYLLNIRYYKSELGFNYLRDAIIKTENARVNYLVLDYNCNDDYFEKHDDAIIKSENFEYNFLAAKKPKSNVQGHLDVILKSNNLEYLYKCLKDIPMSSDNQIKFLRAIYKSGDVKYNYLACMLGLGNDNLNKNLVIKSNILEYIYNLAEKFPDDPFFDIYVETIKESGDAQYIYRLRNLKNYKIDDINNKIKMFEKSIK